jgi:hypothetical protein
MAPPYMAFSWWGHFLIELAKPAVEKAPVVRGPLATRGNASISSVALEAALGDHNPEPELDLARLEVAQLHDLHTSPERRTWLRNAPGAPST